MHVTNIPSVLDLLKQIAELTEKLAAAQEINTAKLEHIKSQEYISGFQAGRDSYQKELSEQEPVCHLRSNGRDGYFEAHKYIEGAFAVIIRPESPKGKP